MYWFIDTEYTFIFWVVEFKLITKFFNIELLVNAFQKRIKFIDCYLGKSVKLLS